MPGAEWFDGFMISVAIPLFNKALSIESTIRCIQAQTVQDLEVVVVEGGSTDGSLDIIKRLAAEDPRIRLLMQQDRRGVTPARNESVAAARSEHIAFLDADDYWAPDYLESMLRLIADYPDANIWGLGYGVQRDTPEGPVRQAVTGSFRGVREHPWTDGLTYWTGATAISREAFDRVGGFDNSIIFGEDIDLWWRLMLDGSAVYDNTCAPAFYRLDAENRACLKAWKPELNIPFHIDKYAEARAANKEFRAFFDYQMLYRLWPYAGKKEYRKALRGVLRQIDFSLQKPSLRWRFVFPRLYRKFKRSE